MTLESSLAQAEQRLQGASIPQHLGVIPDGNRRWAAQNHVSVIEGHRAGFEVAQRLSRFCRRIGIHTITVWAFSTENWRRSGDQVAALMDLYVEWLRDLMPEAIEEEVRVVHLGRRHGVPEDSRQAAAEAGFAEGLPEDLIDAIDEIESKTSGYDRNVINLAINYGGADEMQRAITKLLDAAREMQIDPSSLDVMEFLDTAGQPHPYPDVVWRTSGEIRSSGFLPLQSAYSELVFSPKYFPALSEEDVVDTVLEYSARIRRFGG